jgi:hypothetical protein
MYHFDSILFVARPGGSVADKNVGRTMQYFLELIRKSGNKHILEPVMRALYDVIYKSGARKQIRFLIDNVGIDEAKRLTEQAVADDSEAVLLAKHAEYKSLRDHVVCAVYDEFIREAHGVIMKGIREQVRFLVERKGLEYVRKLIRADNPPE